MTKRPLRTLAAALVAAMITNLLPASLPLLGARTAYADPGTYMNCQPGVFSSYGGYTTVSWDYDYGHPTLIEISRSGVLVYVYEGWFGGGDNSWRWYGQDESGHPVPDGTYLVKVIPNDEWSQFAMSDTVNVFNPPPGAPTVKVAIDQGGNLIAQGTAESGSTVNVYVDNAHAGTTTSGSDGQWQEYLDVTNDTVHTVTATVTARGKTSGAAPEDRFLVHQPGPGEVPSQTADYYLQNGGDPSQLYADNGGSWTSGQPVLVRDPVRAGTPTTSAPVDPRQGASYGTETFAGQTYDPINTSTGAFMLDRTDLVVGGRPALEFRRSYTSGDPYDGPIGYGWHHSYDIRLVQNADGTVDIFRSTGARHRFSPTAPGSSTYKPETPGVFDVLSKNADGTHSLLLQDNTTQVFDSSGLLTRIYDRNGNSVTLTYERGYLLKRVSGSGGTYLEFTYNTGGRIESIEDSSGRTFQYGYDAVNNLTSVMQPDGCVWSYEYDGSHRLTTAKGPLGHTYVINVYNSEGRVVSQTDSRGNVTVVDYDKPHLKTIFVDSSSRVTTDTYDDHDRLVQRTDALGRSEYWSYDEAGNLQSHTDGNGRTTFYEYDPRGRLTRVRDPLAQETAFEYDEQGDLVKVTGPAGQVVSMTRDARGNVDTMTDASGTVTIFEYDSKGNVTKVVSPNGETASFAYDATGLLIGLTDALGSHYGMTYDDAGHLTATSGPYGAHTSVRRDWAGRPVRTVDALGAITLFEYDDEGYLKTITDALGHVYSFTYDPMGNVASTTDPLGQVTEFEYDGLGRVTKRTAPGGAVTTYEYDAAGQLVKATDPTGAQTSMEYDGAGNLTVVTDAKGGTVQVEYDELNRPVKVTDQEGHFTTLEYDAAGRVLASTDQVGSRTTYEYDSAGRLTAVTDPIGDSTTIEYDASGNPSKVTLPTGGTYTYEYEAGQPVRVTDPFGAVTTLNRDAYGNISETVDALGRSQQFEYDLLGRLTKVTDALGNATSYRYDKLGRVTAVIDPLGNETGYEYDPLGRLTAIIDALGGVTEYEYGPFGLTSATDAKGQSTTYERDPLGRLLSMTDALGQTTSYAYDALGNPTRQTDPDGRRTSFEYTPAGLLAKVLRGDGSAVTYEYDAAGRPTKISGPEGTNYYFYDAVGRIIAADDALGLRTLYRYGPAGRTGVTLPDGRTLSYDYDIAGRVSSLTDWNGNVVSFTYDAVGRPVRRDVSNGLSTTYDWTKADRLARIATFGSTGELIQGWGYEYDAAGNTVLCRLLGDLSMLELVEPVDEEDDWLEEALAEIIALREGAVASDQAEEGVETEAGLVDDGGSVGTHGNKGKGGKKAGGRNAGGKSGGGKSGGNTGPDDNATGGEAGGDSGDGAAYADGDLGEADALATDTALAELEAAYRELQEIYSYKEPFRPEASSTSFSYDALNRLIRATDLLPDGSMGETRSYTYDAVGNRLSLTATKPSGEVGQTFYQYNTLNQLVSLTTSKGEFQSFIYDPRGNLTSILGWDEDGEEKVLATYGYDSANRLVSFSDWRGQYASFTYDPEGNRLSRVQSVLLRGPGRGNHAPGQGNAYGHEHAPGQQDDFIPPGQEGGSAPPGQREDFTPPGQAKKLISFNQEESKYTLLLLAAYDDWFDGLSPLDFIYASNGGGKGGGNGGGNGNGNGGGNGNNGGGNGQGSNGNNGNGNGDNSSNNVNGNAYGHDNGNGNGKANGKDNGKGNGQGNGHGNGNAYGHDKGNGKGKGQGNAKGGNNGKALGHQNLPKAPKPEYLTETLYFVNDLADPLAHVAAAYDESGSYTMMNVWDPVSGNLLRSGSSEKTQWALTDALGSTTGLVSNPASTGKTDWHATYDEFGQPMSRRKFDPSFPQGTSYFGFTGEPYDFVTGLTYLRNRYYAPNLGRFSSPDPLGTILGDPTTLNGYGYVMNNPLRWVDPWGLNPADGQSDSSSALSYGVAELLGSVAVGVRPSVIDPLSGIATHEVWVPSMTTNPNKAVFQIRRVPSGKDIVRVDEGHGPFPWHIKVRGKHVAIPETVGKAFASIDSVLQHGAKVLGTVALAADAYTVGSALVEDGGQIGENTTKALGGVVGSWTGAAVGAEIGTAVGAGVGTAIGAAVGGPPGAEIGKVVGAMAGRVIGGVIGSLTGRRLGEEVAESILTPTDASFQQMGFEVNLQ